MKMSPLVNQPNIDHQEAGFMGGNFSLHSRCMGFGAEANGGRALPFFVSVNNGPIQCRACGRRVGKNLRKLLLNHCEEAVFTDVSAPRAEKVMLTYYKLNREDLPEEVPILGWRLLDDVLEGLT